MRLGMGRFVLLLILVSPLCAGVAAATPEPAPALEARQTILEANRSLVKKGWQPAPKQSPSPEERRWSAVPLSSLSTCSGTGVGFCRFFSEEPSAFVGGHSPQSSRPTIGGPRLTLVVI